MNKLSNQILAVSLRYLTETDLKNRIIQKFKNIEWNEILEILNEIGNLKTTSQEYAVRYRRNEIEKRDIIKQLGEKFPNYKKSLIANVFAQSLFETR